jgi:hypothetical protein
MKPFLGVRHVAALFGWKPATIRQLIRRREISCVKVGRNIRPGSHWPWR